MGVPKFFRYISERYPCLSEFVKEYQIPEFDNLYLDMNGIIHNCSHPDDGNPHFRITEEKIFADIFHYIEVLFQMIKPQKLFFMAVDGVAPRAKMNQQRGRRFRSAKDAQKAEDEAVKRGEELPEESRFDSNCITPGTEFMARLHEQLKYLVVKKVSEDPLWQRCEIILSGHETPGEGEHKIMDYIRHKRSEPGYDPNTRHCLYGLDADLIMLGLCTHDPHFSLLREEVKFGKKSSKRSCVPEEIRFYLLHLSLMREYLEMEFSPLKQCLKNFEFNIESIIDDWVLMGFLVGNDFIPNLPNLHIANGALPVLYKVYMDILPKLEGYINESGILNLERFEIFMKKLGELDLQNFEEVRDDLLYMEAKTGRKMQPFSKNNTKLRDLEAWKPECGEDLEPEFLESLETEATQKDSGLGALIAATERDFSDCTLEELTSDCEEDDEFENYKRGYYMSKLEYLKVTPEVMRSQAEGYVRAIQWNLHYYYNGVCSWSWYYPHHYAPYISDIKNFQNLKLEYDIGKPFMPYEQLLAVLPAASRNLLPECFQNLMTDESSPIKKYYPENFDTDLNGKRQDWEAVVLVPFIDEEILLETMQICNDGLSPAERKRNTHGPMLCYKYTEDNLGVYESPMYFPNVVNHAKVHPIEYDQILVPREKLVKGAYPGVKMDVYYPGFPTFKHLQYRGILKKARVKVFEQASRGENMIIQVIPTERVLDAKIPLELLNKTVYVGWPHMVEARVVSLCNATNHYIFVENNETPLVKPSPPTFKQEVENVTEHYSNRLGIEFGKVIVLVKVQTMMGQKYMFTPDGRVSLEKKFCEHTSNYPLQLIVENIHVHDESRKFFKTIEDVFPVSSTCFLLTPNEFYGEKGTVIPKIDNKNDGKVCVSITVCGEPDFKKAKYLANNVGCRYKTLYVAANQLGMSNFMFSRITGSFFVTAKNREGGLKTINLGLNLKLNKKNMETPGYTKKLGTTWFYTDSTIDAVDAYAEAFPEIFDYIARTNQDDETLIENIFPVDSDDKSKAVQAWLKSQPHSHVERRTCNSEVLDAEVIEEIERISDSFAPDESKAFVRYCSPDLLYKPELCFGNLLPDQTVTVQLFDRIIHVRANHTVPYGLKGTVIGVHETTQDSTKNYMYDILFDEKFDGGIEINNCSLGRGYRLPLNAFINISHGERQYQLTSEKTEKKITIYGQNRKDEGWKKSMNHNTNNVKNNVTSSNSAFAKFSNVQLSQAPSYNAVPPFMPDGEPIYKSCNQLKSNIYHQQKYQRTEDSFNYRNPFPKQYTPLNHQNAQIDSGESSLNQINSEDNSYRHIKKNNSRSTTSEEYTGRFVKYYKPPQFYQGPSRLNPSQDGYNQKHNDHNKKFSTNEISGGDKSIKSQKKSDFMPDFRKKEEKISTDETADALKRLLKISSDQDQQATQKMQINQIETDVKPPIDKTEGGPSNIEPGPPFSVQLLSYYQSKGLGLPRYQYITTNDGIQAQMKLPNRQIIIGQPATNKEDASEMVAEKVLLVLNTAEQHPQENWLEQMNESPKNIPAPPSQWCKQNQKADRQKPSNQDNFKQIKNKQPSNDTWRGLIPLQVVKKEKAISSTSSNTTMENLNQANKKNSRTILSEKPANSADNGSKVNQKRDEKPKRQRKMRIAANFAMKS